MKQNKQKIFPLSKQVLYFLAESVDTILEWHSKIMPRNLYRMVYGSPESWAIEERFQQERQIKRALRELKKRKFIKTRSISNRIFYELTDKGKNESLLMKIKLKQQTKTGDFCLVCFDIPEAARQARRALRHFLKITGFKQLQKSIWYSDKDIFEEIKEYIESLKIKRWVTVIRANLPGFS